jgi:hypothetical protein
MRVGRTGVIALLAGLCAGLCGLGVVAASAAGERQGASTRLTIAVWPAGVYGYVSSSNPGACARGRRIEVFGALRHRASRRIAIESAVRNQVGYEWLVDTSRGNAFYAIAKATPGCAAARSRTVSVAPRGAAIARCPSVEGGKCTLVINSLKVDKRVCETFASARGACIGNTSGDVNADWAGRANFLWKPNTTGGRTVDYNFGIPTKGDRCIRGSSPGPSSADYKVSDAHGVSGPRFYTPNVAGVKAGADGGPLYLNFDAGEGQIIIWGTLYVRPNGSQAIC